MIYYSKITYHYLFILALLIIFSGCIDEPAAPENNIINGEIYGGSENLVSIGYYPIIQANWYGGFEIGVVNKPYELVVSGDIYFYYPILKFPNLTINTPKIVHAIELHNFIYEKNGYEPCPVNVFFPPLNAGRKFLALKFISENEFYQLGEEVNGLEGTFSRETPIYIPHDKQTISGKLYYLESRIDTSTGLRFSYDKFGIKDITLTKGVYTNIVFTNEELYDPPEHEMHITINLPSELYSYNTIMYLTNSLETQGSNLLLDILGSGNNKYYTIPVLPVNDFKIKIYNEYCSNIFTPISSGIRYFSTNLGEPAYLNYTETVNLIQPLNNMEDVKEQSDFEISDNDAPAIYEFNIFCNGKMLKLYTNTTKLKFSDFKTRGFELDKNQNYYWAVRKFPNCNNVDEFVSNFYFMDGRYDYIELSRTRSFKTAP